MSLTFSAGFTKHKLSPTQGLEYVHAFRGGRVLLVGDLMLDHYVSGVATRISPEAPVPVIDVCNETWVPGGMGNALANCIALGAEAYAVGVVGDDEAGERLCCELRKRSSENLAVIRVPGRRTTVKTRLVAGSQQVVRIDRESREPISEAIASQIIGVCRDFIGGVNGIAICDYAKGLLTDTVLRGLVRSAQERSKPVCVDPKRLDFTHYSGATLITPNLKEACAASGIDVRSDADLRAAGAELRKTSQSEYILITLGEHGLALFGRDDVCVHVNSTARQVFDVTGAGDTVIAVLTIALANEVPVADGVLLANCAAGLAVEKKGTAAVTNTELANEISGRL